jgi:predicted peptidase
MTTSSSARLQAVSNPSGYDYLLSLPEKSEARPSNQWPLLLFLHGAAQRGSDVWLNTQQGIPRLLAAPEALNPAEQAAAARLAASFIVVAPQCPQLEVWEDATLLALLDQVSTKLELDASRVYLTGLSMGGFGAWSLGMRHPERIAALMPICGGGRLADITTAQPNQKAALQRLGVWAFHGAKDRVVPLEESERMVAALKSIGAGDVQLTVYPDAEHDAWTATYANVAVYDWLLQHAR